MKVHKVFKTYFHNFKMDEEKIEEKDETIIKSKKPITEKTSILKDMKEGFKVIKTIPGLLTIMGIAMLLNMLIQPLTVLMPYFKKITHGGNNFILAILEMVLQLGMIIGAIIPVVKKKWNNSVRTMFVGIIILNIGYLMYAISPIGFYPVMGTGAFILGLSRDNRGFSSVMESMRQGEKGMSFLLGIAHASGEIITAFLIGGVIMGIVASIPSYFVFLKIFSTLREWRRKKKKRKGAGNKKEE